LRGQGQSIWLDYISRGLIASGGLRSMIENDGLRGVTISALGKLPDLLPKRKNCSGWRREAAGRPGRGVWLPARVGQDEFLNALAVLHFAGVNVSFGIGGDRVDPMQLAGVAAVAAE
jgi:hypothetical protein